MRGRAIRRDARNGGVEAGARVHSLDGEVGAQGNARAVVEDAPEGVQAFDALGALVVRVSSAVSGHWAGGDGPRLGADALERDGGRLDG